MSEAIKPTTIAGIYGEVAHSRNMHPRQPGHGYHHYLGVLMEEVDEFKEEVYKRPAMRDRANMRLEALQIAAVMIRFVEEVLDGE